MGYGAPSAWNRPDAARAFRLAVGANALVSGFGIWLGWVVWHAPDKFFRGHLVDTGLSLLQLLAVAALCWQVFGIREATPAAPAPALWRLLTAGFLFLAVDEVGELHEHLDKGLHALSGVVESGLTDRLDDLFVAGYAVVGVAVLWRFRAEFTCFRPLFPYVRAAAVTIASMVVLDVLTSRADIALAMLGPEPGWDVWRLVRAIEDALKLVAEGMLVAIAYAALLHARAVAMQPPGLA